MVAIVGQNGIHLAVAVFIRRHRVVFFGHPHVNLGSLPIAEHDLLPSQQLVHIEEVIHAPFVRTFAVARLQCFSKTALSWASQAAGNDRPVSDANNERRIHGQSSKDE